ncbi:amidohydrolase family protein [Nocardia sp. R7R-8]|uniref:amidohydrolase family protein n=1 Tax=Nocardia sp. R7R-8 TaxID=3459304 RepID=UPI00403D98A3
MTDNRTAELIITGARLWTQDPDRPWAEAAAVRDGRFLAVGDHADIIALAGDDTEIHDLHGAFAVPGLSDGHIHLGLGGTQTIELPLLPSDDLDTIFAKVEAWGRELDDDEWIVGGIVGSTVMDRIITSAEYRARLDEAAGGRPVMLRDDTMHNRWVNSAVFRILGVDDTSPDPEGGQFVRDGDGRLTGVLYEMASTLGEAAFAASLDDPAARKRTALRAAQQTLFALGITSVQEAATMADLWQAMVDLDQAGELHLKIVASTPVRPFLEEGATGDELIEAVSGYESDRVRHTFVKVIMDGVPMTRTASMLTPYICNHSHDDPDFRGEPYWTDEDLEQQVAALYERGLNGKFHATGDAAIRQVLDAAEKARAQRGDGPILQVAHVVYPDPADIPRFAELNVVADVSPHLWYPNVMIESMRAQVPAPIIEASSPLRTLLETGALVAAGSDWPCASPSPNPWPGLEAMVTRRNPDPAIEGVLGESEAVSVEQALTAFTTAPAQAMGLGDVTGRIKAGFSADIAVLDRDLFATPPNRLHETAVLRTYAFGRVVYDATVR